MEAMYEIYKEESRKTAESMSGPNALITERPSGKTPVTAIFRDTYRAKHPEHQRLLDHARHQRDVFAKNHKDGKPDLPPERANQSDAVGFEIAMMRKVLAFGEYPENLDAMRKPCNPKFYGLEENAY